MGIFSDRLNQLWQPPNLRTTEKGRHATWLELFYDLVFVVAVAQLGLLLSRQLTVSRLLEFIFLFIPIWYAWFHHTLYADRFDTDNFAHRFFTFVQMLGMAGVAANVHGAFGETSQVFAASIVIVKLVMVLLYRRCYHIDIARPLAIRLSNVFLISGFLWLLSIFVPTPWRFWIWGLAIIFEFAVVFHRSTRMKYAVMPVSESHVVERFGLFTILVLGEAVAGIVNGAAEAKFQVVTAAVGVLGVLLVFGYWWIYFENLDGSALKGLGGWSPVIWLYIHLPLVISLTALGVGIEQLIAEATIYLEPSAIWLTSGALAVSFAAIGVTHIVVSRYKPETLNPQKGLWRFTAALLAILIGVFVYASGGSALLLIGLLSLVSLGQVIGELFVLTDEGGHLQEAIEEL